MTPLTLPLSIGPAVADGSAPAAPSPSAATPLSPSELEACERDFQTRRENPRQAADTELSRLPDQVMASFILISQQDGKVQATLGPFTDSAGNDYHVSLAL